MPARVLIQCQAQIFAARLERVWVPALVLGYRAEFRLYCVEPHAGLQDVIEREALAFWDHHVVPRVPPDNVLIPPLDLLRRIIREPTSTVALPDYAVRAWTTLEQARAVAREAEQVKADATATVLALLGEAEAGVLPDGRTITYLAQRGAPATDHIALRAHLKEAYATFVTDATHRVLRIKDPE